MTTTTQQETLGQLSSEERLNAVEQILAGCKHLYSKGKLQEDKLTAVLPVFMKLADEDPYFLAHFVSYVMKNSDDKDLKLVSVFVNSLSDADGTPFFVGSKYNKPNLRMISQAAIQDRAFDSKMIERILELANKKQALGKRYGIGTHLTSALRKAVEKYIRYREKNLKSLEGIRKAGMARRFRNLYRMIHIAPSVEAAGILKWPQKDGRVIEKKNFFDFKGMSDIQIATKIRNERIPALGALGALPDRISPVIAVAILEQCTGDQAVILRETFDSQGLLKDKEVMSLYTMKISQARTALDRVERINTSIDEEVTKVLKEAKSESRKKEMGTGFGKVFMHIDVSGSMMAAVNTAKDFGATIAECIQNPEENFFWGLFNNDPRILAKPKSFEKDAFYASLYGVTANGGTDMMACYDAARKLGCDVDIFITDCGHNGQPIASKIASYGANKPKVIGIVQISSNTTDERNFEAVKRTIENAGIPVARISTDALKQSALVVQTLKQALVGKQALIDTILATPLLKLPEWYSAV